MTISLGEIAKIANGTLSGDEKMAITGAATIRDALSGQITFAEHAKHSDDLAKSKASAVIVPANFQPEDIPYITVDNVQGAFAKVVSHFCPPRKMRITGISPQARISASATIAADANIHAGATIGDEVEISCGTTIYDGVCILPGCRIGKDVVIFPNVVLYENTIIGDRAIIHANTVIGAYGFGYDTIEGKHKLSAQLGNVEIGADVEIGACSTIDRGTYGATIIGEGTKIDNQVMVAHNCRIGRHNIFCSHVGIAGSCTTGDYVVMAGQVGIGDHLNIGSQAILGAKAGVMHNIPERESYVGIPATPIREQMVKQAALSKLPELRKQIKALQKVVDQLASEKNVSAKTNAA